MTTAQHSLAQELAATKASVLPHIPEDSQQVMAQATADLQASGIIDRILKVGDRLPDITLPNVHREPVRIQTLLENGPVIITFYRGEWCPYCNIELRALQQYLPDFKAAGATLVAISPQTPDNSLSTTEKNNLEYEVLSDIGNGVARELGLVFTLPETLRPIYENFGIDVPAQNGDRTFELPGPATYVVAPSGEVVYAFAEADYTQRAEPSDILSAVKAI
ncbi:MAG: peroxiredoxin-like family protein [Leptolyngbyaceae bacterium]|nr:peroxiredoxin-like family protein [Leptolyngbyaceae bacterium]